MTRKVKVQKLTKEAFAECGEVVEVPADHTEGGWDDLPFPVKLEAEAAFMPAEGEVQLVVMTVAKRPLEFKHLERYHHGTYEIMIPLGVPMWLPALPPSEEPAGKPDLDRMMVFEVQPHQAVIFKPGAWHFVPFVMEPGTTVSVLAIFNRRGAMEAGVVDVVELEEVIEVVA